MKKGTVEKFSLQAIADAVRGSDVATARDSLSHHSARRRCVCPIAVCGKNMPNYSLSIQIELFHVPVGVVERIHNYPPFTKFELDILFTLL